MLRVKRIHLEVISSAVLLVTLVVVLSGLGGCQSCVRPSFVGVPEAIDRSPDFALTPEAADSLRIFLALEGDRIALEEGEEPDSGELARVNEKYGPVLARLGSLTPISTRDFDPDSEFQNLFDPDIGLLSVHDARVGRDLNEEFIDLVGNRAVALVSGDYVFAFYLSRPNCCGPTGLPDASDDDDGNPSLYTNLVVFKKNFAIAGKGR